MSIIDYATLKTAIADWSHRSDLTSYLDDFIRLAEQRMSGELHVRELEATASGSLSGITLALPADFAQMRRFTITTTTKYSPEMIGADGLRSKYQSASGVPDYYALVGGNIEFDRAPDATYAYALDYYKKPTAITSANTTSTLLTAYPGIYLFACLVEVAWFTKSDADIGKYTQKYQEQVSLANRVGKPSGGPMRVVNG